MLGKALKAVESKLKRSNDQIIYDPNVKVEAVSSGSVIVDMVTGVGGLLVPGRIVEILGLESSGKTTVCLQTCAEAQKEGKVGVYIDTEQTFDYDYAQALGIDLDNETFAVIQPSTYEETMVAIKEIVRTAGKDLDYFIIDSIAMTKPKDLLTGDNKQVGQHANAIQTMFNLFNNIICRKYNIAVLAVNQLRRVPNFGNPYAPKAVKSGGLGAGYSQDDSWTSTGGQAYRYMMSMRFLLEQTKRFKEDTDEKEETGNWIRIKNIKNKLSAPFKKAEFVINFGTGIDDFWSIFNTLKDEGLIYYKAGWYFVDTDGEIIFNCKKKDEFYGTLHKDKYYDTMKAMFKGLLEHKIEPVDEEDIDRGLDSEDLDDDEFDIEDIETETLDDEV